MRVVFLKIKGEHISVFSSLKKAMEGDSDITLTYGRVAAIVRKLGAYEDEKTGVKIEKKRVQKSDYKWT